jgi:hypothetical protein
MPQLVVAAAINYIGTQLALTVGQMFVAQLIGSMAVSSVQRNRAQRKARDAYNASLKDRMQMVDVQANAPGQLVLGRVRTVEGVRRRWSSGTHDEKLTLLVSFAAHEIDAFEQFYLNDEPVTLDGSGWVNEQPYRKSDLRSAQASVMLVGETVGTATYTAAGGIAGGTVYASYQAGGDGDVPTVTVVGNTITVSGNPGQGVSLNWQEAQGESKVRIRTYLGADAQNVGAALAAEYPGKISATDRFAGIALAVVDLIYDQDVFPQGVPNVTAVIRGAKVLDPRTGTTAWSENPALLAYHYARHAQGWAVPAEEIRTSDVNAAASICEASTSFPMRKADGSLSYATLPRYRCGITIDTAGEPRSAMDEIFESMAGRWGWAGGTWRMRAGHSAAPVFAMDPGWIMQALGDDGMPAGSGAVVKLTNGVPRESKVNAISGECVDPDQRWQVLAFPAVRDAALIAGEGEYPLQVEYQGVNHIAHAQHLARVTVRQGQAALRMEAQCGLQAYRCELFDVGAVTLPRYGFDAKLFEVIGWRWHPTQGVQLSLAETAAEIYDVAELTGRDPAPNSTLAGPFDVPQVTLLDPLSGSAQLLRQADGTVISRILVRWAAVLPEGVRQSGQIEVRYGPANADPATWQSVTAPGADTQIYLVNVQDGAEYVILARASNGLVRGRWSVQRLHVVQGKTAPPTDVTGLASAPVIGGVSLTWDPCADVDYAETELRVGPTWAHASTVVVWAGAASSYAWATAPGTYHVMARHRDTSGNYSVAEADLNLVVSSSSATAGLVLDVAAAAFVLPASSAGVVSSYAGASTSLRVLAGGVDDTANWTLARTNGPGVSSTLAAGTLTITALADATDVSYVDCTATRSGYATLTRRVPVSKAKAGAAGANGTNGNNGLNGANGADGANGVRTADARVFTWALSVPAGPTGTGTYTWATGAISAAPAGWSLTPGTATAGFTLYSATVRLSNTNTTATDTINWTGASVAPLSAPGAPGAAGAAGASARIAYAVLSSGSTLGTGTRTSTGSTSVPATGAWGLGEAWQSTAPSYGTNQTVWQSNGIFNPASNTVTWDSPYISALKVGSLSAISANLGTVTAGEISGITITGGLFQTAASGTRITLNESATANFRIYGNIGAGEQIVAQIGPNTWGTAGSVAYFGSPSSGVNKDGVTGVSNSATGVVGASTSGIGVLAINNSGGTALRADGGMIVNSAAGITVQTSGVNRGLVWFNSGTLKIEAVGAVPIGLAVDGVVRATVGTAGLQLAGGIGCHGAGPQPRYSLPAAGGDALVNAIRQALINCGICQ